MAGTSAYFFPFTNPFAFKERNVVNELNGRTTATHIKKCLMKKIYDRCAVLLDRWDEKGTGQRQYLVPSEFLKKHKKNIQIQT